MKNIIKIICLAAVFVFINTSYSQWFQTSSGTTADLNAIHFRGVQTGFACGENGLILQSIDYGLTWFPVVSGTTEDLNDILMADPFLGFAVGNNGVICRTTNGGATWNAQNISGGSYVEISMNAFISPTVLFAVNSTGLVFKTTDLGVSWTSLFSPAGIAPNCGFFPNHTTGFAAGPSSTIKRTTNSGASWQTVYSSTGTLNSVYVSAIFENYAWAVGSSGKYLRSTNSGLNWIVSIPTTSNAYNDVYFPVEVPGSTGWIVGNSGIILKTTNYGVTYMQQQSPVNANLNSIFAPGSDNYGWIAGDNGTILRTLNGGVIGITQISGNVPESFSLCQNYPNPFNPETNIKFTVPKSAAVKLIIYDITGREVETLVNQQLSAGTYKVDWEASAHPSGVYYYMMSSDNFKQTNRMALIK
jgi:photosystem II stability/assembly factor-like uncharacterized protein